MFDETQKDEVVHGLQKLNLGRKDALVYMALLRLGETGTGNIIEDTGLHGQYVYESLRILESRGLAQHVTKRGRMKFLAKNPEAIRRLVDQQKAVADTVVEKLQSMMTLPKEASFEVFQGRESYVAHEFELLDAVKAGSELLIIGGSGGKFNLTMGESLRDYARKQEHKKIHIRYIGSDDQRKEMAETHGRRRFFEIRYLPGLFTGEVNTNVWPDAIAFNIFAEPVTHFTISNSVVAASYRQFFETLWKLAKE